MLGPKEAPSPRFARRRFIPKHSETHLSGKISPAKATLNVRHWVSVDETRITFSHTVWGMTGEMLRENPAGGPFWDAFLAHLSEAGHTFLSAT